MKDVLRPVQIHIYNDRDMSQTYEWFNDDRESRRQVEQQAAQSTQDETECKYNKLNDNEEYGET